MGGWYPAMLFLALLLPCHPDLICLRSTVAQHPVGCKTLRPRVSHRLYKSWANGAWFYTIPPLLMQPTIWPQPWDVGSARIRPEERIDGYKLSLGFGTAYYCAPNRPSTRKMQAWLTSIPTAKYWGSCCKFPATDGSTLVVWLDHPSKCYSCNRSFNVAQRSFLPVYDFWQKVVDIMSSSRIINWRSLITSLNCLLCEIAEFRELQPWIFTAIFRYYVKVQKLRITAMSAISNWNCLFDHRRMMVNSFNSKPPVWSFGRNHML